MVAQGAEREDNRINLKDVTIYPAAIAEVPAKIVYYYAFMPIKTDGYLMTVAMATPPNIQKLDDISRILKKKIEVILVPEADLTDALKKYYGVGADTIDKMVSERLKDEAPDIPPEEARGAAESADDASIIKFINQIMLEAHKDRATDIHIEPYENELRIRYRIDGILHYTKVPSSIKNFQSSIISRIKIMANLDIAEHRVPQDGRINIKTGDNDVIDMRVSTIPTPFGESIVIRLLSTNVNFKDFGLADLGLEKKDGEIFEALIRKPHGVIFLTGPTGSGKTTTLYTCLNMINDEEKKIITIEDPIEYQMGGITQIQVNPKTNLTFAEALRSILRHDPDVIMVGEVRDFETADIVIRTALTGHLVFSTLHTNDAAGGITRLLDMGVEPFLVTSTVECFIAQRLVRVICPECKHPVKIKQEVLREIGMTQAAMSNASAYEGKGCEACKNTGYRGRTAIYEMLVMHEPIRELVLRHASADEIRKKAVALGMKTLRQDGLRKVLEGITTLSEVMRVAESEES
ncbi:MAG: type II/IV secretion system protein [Candidatus Omnitrophica bacterium]|nr:type II/IV secretion system protein [Candidatus Omnitrophota bacterium]